jgi:superfamily I DNA and/or RNA helicase
MVVALAIFLLKRGISSEDITILAAYLGQTKVLRQKLREAQQRLTIRSEDNILVQTVDMYQGDENKYIIVSLVRSGVDNIGFLDSLNRRCVAQSRAKCGLYFVGNADTLVKRTIHGKTRDTVWKKLIDQVSILLKPVSSSQTLGKIIFSKLRLPEILPS